MREALILGVGDVLQVRDVVVARVAVFVVHLPRGVTRRITEESLGNDPVDIEILSTHLCTKVARSASRSKGNGTTRVANPAMGTHLPAPAGRGV